MAGLNGKTGAAVPLHHGASRERGGTFAAHVIEAIALPCGGIVKLAHELAGIIKSPSRTVIVNSRPISKQRTPFHVARRRVTLGQQVGDAAGDDLADRRAPGDVDDRAVGENVLDPGRSGRVRPGGLHASVIGTGADGQDILGFCRSLAQHDLRAFTAYGAVGAVGSQRDGSIDQQDMLLAGSVLQRFVGLLACGGHEQFHVLHGDEVEHQVADACAIGTQRALQASRAFLELKPDDHGPFQGLELGGQCIARARFSSLGNHRAEAH